MPGRQESKENPGRVGNTERRLEDDCGGDVENPRGQETPPENQISITLKQLSTVSVLFVSASAAVFNPWAT